MAWWQVGLQHPTSSLPSLWVKHFLLRLTTLKSWWFSYFLIFSSNVYSSPHLDWSGWWAMLIGPVKPPLKSLRGCILLLFYRIWVLITYYIIAQLWALERKVPFTSLSQKYSWSMYTFHVTWEFHFCICTQTKYAHMFIKRHVQECSGQHYS